jgi:hypothetical protein
MDPARYYVTICNVISSEGEHVGLIRYPAWKITRLGEQSFRCHEDKRHHSDLYNDYIERITRYQFWDIILISHPPHGAYIATLDQKTANNIHIVLHTGWND